MEMDPQIWATTDGHRYTSVPTEVPTAWERKHVNGYRTYVSGDYEIERLPYGTKWTYWVSRNDIALPLAFYGRLMDAKDRAVENAEGRDVMNVA